MNLSARNYQVFVIMTGVDLHCGGTLRSGVGSLPVSDVRSRTWFHGLQDIGTPVPRFTRKWFKPDHKP